MADGRNRPVALSTRVFGRLGLPPRFVCVSTKAVLSPNAQCFGEGNFRLSMGTPTNKKGFRARNPLSNSLNGQASKYRTATRLVQRHPPGPCKIYLSMGRQRTKTKSTPFWFPEVKRYVPFESQSKHMQRIKRAAALISGKDSLLFIFGDQNMGVAVFLRAPLKTSKWLRCPFGFPLTPTLQTNWAYPLFGLSGARGWTSADFRPRALRACAFQAPHGSSPAQQPWPGAAQRIGSSGGFWLDKRTSGERDIYIYIYIRRERGDGGIPLAPLEIMLAFALAPPGKAKYFPRK